MFVGRETEIKYLNYFYAQQGNQLLVLYGQRGVGKTTLLKQLSESHPTSFYNAVSVSSKQQKSIWAGALGLSQAQDYRSLLQGMVKPYETRKQILVLDEFHYLIRNDSNFMNELTLFLGQLSAQTPILLILCSSQVAWVEQDMIKELGKTASSIAGLLKVKKLSFSDILKLYPTSNKRELLKYYGLLGGMPGLWNQVNPEIRLEDFLSVEYVTGRAPLYRTSEKMLEDVLRETGVYNTILFALAQGVNKLNDMYARTEYSRAKISVYLKNLATLGFTERIFSFDQGNQREIQKGIYRICEPLLYFYFRFMFANAHLSPQQLYETVINPGLTDLYHTGYVNACKEFLKDKMVSVGEWFGKSGKMDIVCKDSKNQYYVCKCLFDRTATEADLEELKKLAKKAGIKPTRFLIFEEGTEPSALSGKDGVLCLSILRDE